MHGGPHVSQEMRKAFGKIKNFAAKDKCSLQKKKQVTAKKKKKKKKLAEISVAKGKNACGKRKWLKAERRKIVTENNSCSLKSAKSGCLVFKN